MPTPPAEARDRSIAARPESSETSRPGAWSLVMAAGALTAAGTGIVLLSKPFGGTIGIPGAVVGYIVATAIVLGAAFTVPVLRCRPVRGRWPGALTVLAGAGAVVAGIFPAPVVFCCGVLVLGAAGVPVLMIARATGTRMFYPAASAGAFGAAIVAAAYFTRPGVTTVVSGVLTLVAGVALMMLWPNGIDVDRSSGDRLPGACWGYAAIGFELGATVLPALHLLLFRWDVLGAGQPTHLAVALVPAVLAALLGAYRARELPLLLVLAAGGPVLVATAPGAWRSTVGIALVLAVAVRALAVADHAMGPGITRSSRSAGNGATALVFAAGVGAGLAIVAGLGRVWGTGSALTMSSVPVLLAALLLLRMRAPAIISVHIGEGERR